MSFIKNYINYLKDNPNKYWFKRKLYGWGWVPVRWQGWVVILAFILFIVLSGMDMESNITPTDGQLILFFVKIVLSVAVVMWICYKTGEKPKWQWGPPQNSNQK
ncbi:MAG: hypothetical protein WC705_01720 [Candidatus Paceibacterota bacterium]|jgi:uncharacterized membrane protein YhaH (DUF805 family)